MNLKLLDRINWVWHSRHRALEQCLCGSEEPIFLKFIDYVKWWMIRNLEVREEQFAHLGLHPVKTFSILAWWSITPHDISHIFLVWVSDHWVMRTYFTSWVSRTSNPDELIYAEIGKLKCSIADLWHQIV